MRILTASDIARLLPYSACIGAMREAMRRTSERAVVLPLRQFMNVPGTQGKLGLMPGYLSDPAGFGVKIVSKFPRAPGAAHGSHVGAVMLFDAAEGLPLALLDGGMLTAIRTASTTAMATDALARPDAQSLLLVGCGEEAEHHLAALREVRAFGTIRAWGRDPGRAAAFAARMSSRHGRQVEPVGDLAAAVAAADVICTVTSAATPVLRGEWLVPGQHVNLVGSAVPTTAEADGEVVRRSRFYVDYREAAMAAAGELLAAIRDGLVTAQHVRGEIGEVLLGRVAGRESAADVTLYKSLGVTSQDLAAAHLVYETAVARGVGLDVELGH
ncbi:MAG: ornithine cyclodeaminase family protein [Steroidobacteraceae bacterium]|jgi:ornithine cyclodeaminase|nr:ornithine cyclodeaminase family protein [Steroidobacteraceae bacterium]